MDEHHRMSKKRMNSCFKQIPSRDITAEETFYNQMDKMSHPVYVSSTSFSKHLSVTSVAVYKEHSHLEIWTEKSLNFSHQG